MNRLWFTFLSLASLVASQEATVEDFPSTRLGNGDGERLPLIGMGVGNLQRDMIEYQIMQGVGYQMGIDDQGNEENKHEMMYRLIDTSHVGDSEGLVSHAIQHVYSRMKKETETPTTIHVITKVWYTHLGYERTILSVKESMENLKNPNLKVHLMIQWPRCTETNWQQKVPQMPTIPNTRGFPEDRANDVEQVLNWLRNPEDETLDPIGDILRVDSLIPRRTGQSEKGRAMEIENALHWLKMNCEQEEVMLPDHVKKAGPPPHLKKDDAFKGSWKALEDIFLGKVKLGDELPTVASIGVANFEVSDLKELVKGARVVPHILQTNVWSFIFDPELIDYCKQNNIHFQVYNVMNGIATRESAAPTAFESLHSVAKELTIQTGYTVTPAQTVLKWLVQNNVSIIPRSSNLAHLHENSPTALSSIPDLSTSQEAKIREAAGALLQGKDLDRPQAIFVNKKASGKVNLFWKGHDGSMVPVHTYLEPGETFEAWTFPGHVFVVHDPSKAERKEFLIKAHFGESQHIIINDEEEDEL